MKNFLLFPLLLFFCFGFQAMAQDQHQIEQQDRALKKIIERLALNEHQATDFTRIYKNRQNELRDQKKIVRKNSTTDEADQSAMQEKRQASRENYRHQLKEVLNDQQLKQFDRLWVERKANKQFETKDKALKMGDTQPKHRLVKDEIQRTPHKGIN